MEVTERLIAGHTLTNTVYERMLNVKARLKQSLLPFMTSPDLKKKCANSDELTVKMIGIIQLLPLFTIKGQMFIQFVILDP